MNGGVGGEMDPLIAYTRDYQVSKDRLFACSCPRAASTKYSSQQR